MADLFVRDLIIPSVHLNNYFQSNFPLEFQCLVTRCNSKVLNLWKNIYRLLLQIQITGEGCSLSQCLLQLTDCAKHINNYFEKSEL